MDRELLQGEVIVGNDGDSLIISTSHEWASDILINVGNCLFPGGYPANISAFDLGRAVGRALTNSNEEYPLAELVRGYTHSFTIRKTNQGDN